MTPAPSVWKMVNRTNDSLTAYPVFSGGVCLFYWDSLLEIDISSPQVSHVLALHTVQHSCRHAYKILFLCPQRSTLNTGAPC